MLTSIYLSYLFLFGTFSSEGICVFFYFIFFCVFLVNTLKTKDVNTIDRTPVNRFAQVAHT